jgi:hypothetical protein
MSLQIDVEPKSENLQTGAPNLEANFSDYGNELVDFFLKAGILTPKQVQHAQRVSSKIETSKPLTIILKELNFITHDQIIDALQNRPISMPLGNLLVELGHIHQADLQLAKDIQTSENSKRDFDKILIDQGLIDEKTLMQTRALKLGIPYIEPTFSEIDRALFSMAPIKIFIEPLCNRPEDISPLIDHYVKEYASQFNVKKLSYPSPKTIDKLCEHHWPGNVRELQNVLKRIMILGDSEESIDAMFNGHISQAQPLELQTPEEKPPISFDLWGGNGENSLSPGSFSLKKITKKAVARVEKEIISYVLEKQAGIGVRLLRY